MSTVAVEQPSTVAHSSPQGLATDDIEMTGFRPAPRRTSIAALVNADDNNSRAGMYIGPSRRGSTLSMSTDNEHTSRDSSPVIVLEDPEPREARGSLRASNGAQHEPIIVLDSDEEQGQPSDRAGSSFRRRQGVRRRGGGPSSSSFRIFSPSPPPPQRHPVPPVPFLPPIIAEPAPFAILPPPVNNLQRQRMPFDQPFDPPPRSRNNNASHGNGIQLGGGLISQGNGVRRHGPRAQVRFQPRRSERLDELLAGPGDHPPLERASRIFGRFFASYFSGNTFVHRPANQNPLNSSRGRSRVNPGDVPHHYQDEFEVDWADQAALPPGAGFFGVAAFSGLGPWDRRDLALGLGPEYDRRMTHPERAGPGWTYDFGTEQEEGGSKTDGSEILVCAKCLDPLLANADGMVDVSEEEKKGRRVWSLRCGHVLDGKCIGTLMVPEDPKKDINCEHRDKRRNTGYEKQLDPEPSENEVDGLVTGLDIKGKGKAPALHIHAPTPLSLGHREKSPIPSLSTELEENLPNTSIRSRLRSRRSSIPASSATTTSSSLRRSARHLAAPNNPRARDPSVTRRRGTKRKRVPEVVTEVIEARHEWMCPVSGCGRMHVSLNVGGVWKMDPESGAIAIFV